jgi:hypothetical protein
VAAAGVDTADGLDSSEVEVCRDAIESAYSIARDAMKVRCKGGG